ncbi:hypothetical protein [Mycolicibacterium sediminis]|uniref:Uncharacterized protein n=1 Tax=Mycolicibacterium sediminis TaxID=1286180 RepID=A0A7I7QY15_9MYCO|nr:hypothetical protein [Mycolicibacterium sediminis]BBY31273.1 hypothetical protein MSEDJ_53690 [Mycolicibacterium sediminis]
MTTLLVTVVTACGAAVEEGSATTPSVDSPSTLSKPEFTNYPAQTNNFRFHWSAAPGIDLLNGAAVPLRAYVESVRLADLTGGDTTVVYPGFSRATPENKPVSKPGDLFQEEYVRPKTRAEYEANGLRYVESQTFGYQPTHILSLQPSGNGLRATLCVGTYSVYVSAADKPGQYVSTAADGATGQLRSEGRDTVQVWRVELTDQMIQSQNTALPVPGPEAGPLPAPLDDVFGNWFITGLSQGELWGPSGQGEDVETPEVRQQCEAAMPDDAATRTAMATGFHDAPPPHGDPIPGWPAAEK